MKYKSVALLFVIQLLQFPSFSYIKLISFRSEVNTLYASQIHIFHSDFLFQIYQDFSSFLCLCIYRFLYRKNRIAQHCDRLLLLPKVPTGDSVFRKKANVLLEMQRQKNWLSTMPFLLKIPKKRKSISPLTQALKMEILLLFWMH